MPPMTTRWTALVPAGIFSLAAGTTLVFCGCTTPSSLRLEQPRLSEPQCRLDLISEQVWWTESGGVHRVLVEIPLPGAGTGRPTYLLYLRVTIAPDSQGEPETPADLRGFLIQTRGPQAGLTLLTRGNISGPPPAGTGDWSLRVDLPFEDGSRLAGNLLAVHDDWRLTRFETRSHTADVQALLTEPAPIMNQHR